MLPDRLKVNPAKVASVNTIVSAEVKSAIVSPDRPAIVSRKKSDPVPPVSMSAPAPPVSVSLPAKPLSVSPAMVPTSVSSPAVPLIGAIGAWIASCTPPPTAAVATKVPATPPVRVSDPPV